MVTLGWASRVAVIRSREAVAINGEGRTGGDAGLIGGGNHERAEPAHLFLEDADGSFERIVAQRVGAYQFGETAGLMGLRHADRAHFVKADGDAPAGELPCGFAAGESGADYVYGMIEWLPRRAVMQSDRAGLRAGVNGTGAERGVSGGRVRDKKGSCSRTQNLLVPQTLKPHEVSDFPPVRNKGLFLMIYARVARIAVEVNGNCRVQFRGNRAIRLRLRIAIMALKRYELMIQKTTEKVVSKMSAEQNAELVTRTWQSVVKGDAETALANMSDEISWVIPGPSGECLGPETRQGRRREIHIRDSERVSRKDSTAKSAKSMERAIR